MINVIIMSSLIFHIKLASLQDSARHNKRVNKVSKETLPIHCETVSTNITSRLYENSLQPEMATITYDKPTSGN